MTMMKQTITCLALSLLVFTACKKEVQSTVQDADQTAALKNVTVTYEGMTYQMQLPDGATSGKSFDELRREDSAKYSNPANYGMTYTATMHADNNKDHSSDAKFDGMDVNAVFDTVNSEPLKTSAGPFTVPAHNSKTVNATGTINLQTHKHAGLYMFRQVADGNDIATTLFATMNYKVGALNGTIPLPSSKQNIPTAANEETKNFLRGMLSSGIFN